MVSDHPLDIEVFYSDDLVLINELSAQFMVMVTSLVADMLMDSCDNDSLLLPVLGTRLHAGQLPLLAPEFLHGLLQIFWVLVVVLVAVNSEFFDADINADDSINGSGIFHLDLIEDRDKILPGRGLSDSCLRDFTVKFAKTLAADNSKERELYGTIHHMNRSSIGGGITLLVGILFTFEFRIPALLFEELLVGVIQLTAGVFQSLAVSFLEPGKIGFHPMQQVLHVYVTHVLFPSVIDFLLSGEHMVIYEPATPDGLIYLLFLFFRWV